MLTITPWDMSVLRGIEKAIQTSDLGVNPQNDGKVIRLVFPPLNEERRKELSKEVSKLGEEAKVAIRSIRRDAIEKLKEMKKSGDITEDDLKQAEKKTQDLTDKYVKNVDECAQRKEKEIMASEPERGKRPCPSRKKRTGSGCQSSCPPTSASSWTATAGGRKNAFCPVCRPSGGRVQFSHHHPLLLKDRHPVPDRVRLFHRELEPPCEEVGALLRLFKEYLEEALRDFMDENIRVRFIGDVSAFPPSCGS